MRRRRDALIRAVGWGVVAVVLGALAACGRATPGCDRASAQLDTAHLAAAAEAYARAADGGEGDCADAGLNTVGARYVTAYQNVARGRAAEDRHDRDAAATAYRAALGDDADNPAARDGLARLGAPAPAAPPTAAPAAASAAATPSWLVLGLLVATLTLLGAVVVLVVRLVRSRRRAPDAPDAQLDTVRRRIEEILEADSAHRTAERDHRPAWADEQLAVLRTLQENLDALAPGSGNGTNGHGAPALPGGPGHDPTDDGSDRLRRDLVDLVAFLDHRLPPRGLTHDRFGAAAEPGTVP